MRTLLAILLSSLCGSAVGMAIQWRLVGTSTNFERGTTLCAYEGRTAEGNVVTATRIVRGYVCPMTPNGS